VGVLGRIGLPEAMSALNEIHALVMNPNEDSNVKSLALWTIGRLGPDTLPKCKKALIKELTNPFWKVRTTACMAVCAMGEGIAQSALPVLTKILKDGTVNRQTVSETMINLGPLGEQTILTILKEDS
jgi:HEAT repeat protein